MGASQTEQEPLLDTESVPTLKERVDAAVAAAHVAHGYVRDGAPDRGLVEDKVYALVSVAEVEKRADRGSVAITRSALVGHVFDQVAGPDAWEEQEDPEVAEELWKRLDGMLWRMCNPDSSGKVQARLNTDSGLILCRTQATPENAWAVYVTRDLQCLLSDFSGPHKDRLKKEADRFATNLAMAVDRLPEFAGRFRKELTSGMKTALGSGTAILVPAIEASVNGTEDPEGDE